MDIKNILESKNTIEKILNNLTKDPYDKFYNLFSQFKERNFFFSYEEGILTGFCTEKVNLDSTIIEVRKILKENRLRVVNISSKEVGIGHLIEFNLLKKDVDNFCR